MEDITILVHDWGGPIGLGYATRNPKKIKRIIITNTAAFAMKQIPFRIQCGKTPWLGRKLIMNLNMFLKCALNMTVSKRLNSNVKYGYSMPFKDSIDSRIGILRFVQDIPIKPTHQSFEALLRIQHSLWTLKEKKVAIIWGMKDWCFTEVFYNQWFDYFQEVETLQLKKAGHWLFEDAIDDIIPFMEHFFSDN